MKAPENIKFWTILTVLMLATAVAVMLIDLSIKAAILEESNALRRVILNGRGEEKPATSGTSDDSSSPSVLLDFDPTGMETGNVRQSSNGKASASTPPRKPRTKPRAQGNPPEVPPGN
jgi:hypothetical protein